MALLATRAMLLSGHEIQVGQAVDGLWPTLRERTRRALLSTRRVVQDEGEVVVSAGEPAPAVVEVVKRKRGRPRKHPLPEAANG